MSFTLLHKLLFRKEHLLKIASKTIEIEVFRFKDEFVNAITFLPSNFYSNKSYDKKLEISLEGPIQSVDPIKNICLTNRNNKINSRIEHPLNYLLIKNKIKFTLSIKKNNFIIEDPDDRITSLKTIKDVVNYINLKVRNYKIIYDYYCNEYYNEAAEIINMLLKDLEKL